jgi:hemerythrin superfamily protein
MDTNYQSKGGQMADKQTDAIALLEQDHKAVKQLFREFEGKTDRAFKGKLELYQKIRQELEVHTQIEEQLFYPAAKEIVPDMVAEAMEEHQQVDRLLEELHGMDPSDERFDAKMTVMIENVEHHAEEEEKEMFPGVRGPMGADRLRELGMRMMDLKQQLVQQKGMRAA